MATPRRSRPSAATTWSDFQRRYYGPRGMVLAMVGAVDPARAVEQVAQALGDWQNPAQPEPPALPPWTPLQGIEHPPRGHPRQKPGRSDPGDCRPAAQLPPISWPPRWATTSSGSSGMMGRIGDVVREQAGLAYYAYSSLSGGIGPGPWHVSAGVDPANIDQAIDLIRAEIARFVNEPVTAEELADSQANYIGRLPLSLESNAGVAGALLNLERYALGLDYYRRYPDLIRAVTRQDVLDAARHYLHPDRLGIAVAGP